MRAATWLLPIGSLLIVAAASVMTTGAAAQEAPGTGELLATVGGEEVSLPMARLDVRIAVNGTVVRGAIEQTFTNPGADPVEAVYVFPLPEGAAVNGLTLQVGDRRFVGEIREKGEARATYERARQEGRHAGLVEQHRPNLFTTAVSNVPAGAAVVVTLSYLDEADWQDGEFSTVFPLTVTPRYAARGTPPPASESGSVLASLRVSLEAGVPLAWATSPSHGAVTALSGSRAEITVDAVRTDRDFVLRWKPAAESTPVAGGLVEERDGARYLSVSVIPPELDGPGRRGLSTQTVFVVDVSGSMQGASIEQARAALLAALDRQRPGDTFAIIRFCDRYETFREGLLPADPSSLREARAWVSGLAAGGGTEILPALLRALELSGSGDEGSLRRVVLITDGAVSDEEEVLSAVAAALGGTRLHVVGIGDAPNRWLMTALARSGRGVAAFVGSIDEVSARIDALLERTERAIVTDVLLEADGSPIVELAPDPIPDLYSGRPLVITARLEPGRALSGLRLRGRAPGGPVAIDLPVTIADAGAGIGTRWARSRVEALEDSRRRGGDPAAVRAEVIDLAKRFSLVTAYTSFLAVEDESAEITAEGLPSCGTLEPLFLALGAVLAAAGILIVGAARLVRGGGP